MGAWAPSVNVPYGVSELGAPGGYTAVLERGMKENDAAQRQARQRTPPCPAGRGSAPAAPRGSTDGRDDGERSGGVMA